MKWTKWAKYSHKVVEKLWVWWLWWLADGGGADGWFKQQQQQIRTITVATGRHEQ